MQRNIVHGTACLLLLFAFSYTVNAQVVPDLVTDRPDQTESAETVPYNWLQIEAGAIAEETGSVSGQTVASWTVPTVLLRYGLSEAVELRLGSSWLVDEKRSDPLQLGFKYRLTGESLPPIALLCMFTLPSTIAGNYPSNDPSIELRLSAEQSLTAWASFGLNLAYESDLKVDADAIHYTAVIGFDLSERNGVFLEIYGSNKTGNRSFRHRFDAGWTYLLTRDLQYDISSGVELNPVLSSRYGWFVSTGASWRFALRNE